MASSLLRASKPMCLQRRPESTTLQKQKRNVDVFHLCSPFLWIQLFQKRWVTAWAAFPTNCSDLCYFIFWTVFSGSSTPIYDVNHWEATCDNANSIDCGCILCSLLLQHCSVSTREECTLSLLWLNVIKRTVAHLFHAWEFRNQITIFFLLFIYLLTSIKWIYRTLTDNCKGLQKHNHNLCFLSSVNTEMHDQ